ncbi:hypothetical protein ACTA71_004139 [Dictyostelium dimigraforme]
MWFRSFTTSSNRLNDCCGGDDIEQQLPTTRKGTSNNGTITETTTTNNRWNEIIPTATTTKANKTAVNKQGEQPKLTPAKATTDKAKTSKRIATSKQQATNDKGNKSYSRQQAVTIEPQQLTGNSNNGQ